MATEFNKYLANNTIRMQAKKIKKKNLSLFEWIVQNKMIPLGINLLHKALELEVMSMSKYL